MSNRRDLKSYVRYDGSGRVVPGSNILRRKKPKVGNWKEIDTNVCCNPTPPTPVLALRLTFDSIENANLLVGDSSSVEDWNIFFDLPTYGNPFTSVSISGDTVQLFGGSNIEVKLELFADNINLLHIYDDNSINTIGDSAFGNSALITAYFGACTNTIYTGENLDYGNFGQCSNLSTIAMPSLITLATDSLRLTAIQSIDFPLLETIGQSAINFCASLTTVNLPLVTSIGFGTFNQCTALTSIDLPLCTDLGGSVGDDFVFNNINGNTITATFNNVLATCNAGSPDGDIDYLDSNNTVTITYV